MNTSTQPAKPRVVTRDEWLTERKALLEAEKAHTRAYDELMRKRRALPWVKIDQEYVFDSSKGPVTLADLFDGRSQLFVYHFMLGPGWLAPCSGCAFLCDHVDAARQHFEQADLSFAAVSRASVPEIEKVKKRLGWKFNWVSSQHNRFNFDYGVSFTKDEIASGQALYNYAPYTDAYEDIHGRSIFVKDEAGQIYHTYSNYARGGEDMIGAFKFLDYTPKGRNESEGIMCWVRLHDEYETTETNSACCH